MDRQELQEKVCFRLQGGCPGGGATEPLTPAESRCQWKVNGVPAPIDSKHIIGYELWSHLCPIPLKILELPLVLGVVILRFTGVMSFKDRKRKRGKSHKKRKRMEANGFSWGSRRGDPS